MSNQNSNPYLRELEQDKTRLEEENMLLRTERKETHDKNNNWLFKRSMFLFTFVPIIGMTPLYNYSFVQGNILSQSIWTLVGLIQSQKERKTLISLGVLEDNNINKAASNITQSFSFKKL